MVEVDFTKIQKVWDDKFNNLHSMILDTQSIREPSHRDQQIEALQVQMERFETTLLELRNKVNNVLSNNFVELIEDQELIDLWKMSGLRQKQVAEKFAIDESLASRYCNAKVESIFTRAKLKQYFLDTIAKEELGK